MVDNTEKLDIKVSARILRHISRGIYRTPAGALKELISNSYDACAKEVTINTGYPTFEKIIVTDNGNGMVYQEFREYIEHIGLSNKVAGTEITLPNSKNVRITIGHYGIGMLAIGQLCKRAKITSKTANSLEGFEATIDFEQFDIQNKDGINRAVIKDEKYIEEKETKRKRIESENESVKDEKFSIGECFIKKLKYSEGDKDKHFTKLELEQVRDLVQQKLSGNIYKDYPNFPQKQLYFSNFDILLQTFRENEEVIQRGQYPYEKLCWELAIYSPLKYPNIELFKKGKSLNFIKEIADKENFTVVIDGMEIYKPFEEFFFNEKGYEIRHIFKWEDEIYKNNRDEIKKVSGYLVFRQKIRPKCLYGVLIRVAGVAIGNYDATFLSYPYHQAAKFEQLTGELFVEGLSGALNIDRGSFNETDDDYLLLIKWFHTKLHKEVFPIIQKALQSKREDVSISIENTLKQYFDIIGKECKVKIKKLGKNEPLFTKNKKELLINRDHPLGKPNQSAFDKLVLSSILIMNGHISPENMENILRDYSKSWDKNV